MTDEIDRKARALEALAVTLRPVGRVLADSLAQTTEVVVDALRWGGARFGRLADVAGGLLADPLYAWRVGNRVRLWQKLKDVDLPAGAIPDGWAAKVLISAEETDNSELLDMWAKLLLSGQEAQHRHPGYVEVLRSLSPAEAKFMRETYYRGYSSDSESNHAEDGSGPEHQHFISLGIVGYSLLPRLQTYPEFAHGMRLPDHLRFTHTIYVTEFGAGLCDALGIVARESTEQK